MSGARTNRRGVHVLLKSMGGGRNQRNRSKVPLVAEKGGLIYVYFHVQVSGLRLRAGC